ncbi:MarR family transcriptional regulator [Parvularcula flava]|uniref:MarR family transcriptional regulator n=1 Tax=Aquisalinus luteolus TaxID=1566827 RepID=A0A8J3EPP5_9PROT|nr:MarR family transcriptional regulator [Aquisalinus luteolus]NHK26351.1 MarR family transcriptional regulator [Aquisalinus luteolus]GGH92070.1 MarR family transcriptional regulator [Aquisalinus luteolus]
MQSTDILLPWRDIMVDSVRRDVPDLSMRQWAILLSVYLTPGPHTVRKMSADFGIPKPAISRALDALSILGFIQRVRDPNDKRIVLVRKTADGALFVDEFARRVEERTRLSDLGGGF